MSDLNKLFTIGRLTADPTMNSANGINCCNFTVASDLYTSKDGQKKTNFYRVAAWRGLADICGKYLHKGDLVFVSGDPEARAYTDKQGQVQAMLQITADKVQFLSTKRDGASQDSTITTATNQNVQHSTTNIAQATSDELPF